MSFELQRKELMATKNFIAGVWQDAVAGETLSVNNPATGERVALVPNSDAKDAKAAVDAAAHAFEAWRTTPAKQRAVILKRWNDLIMACADDLGKIISSEQGKPLSEAVGEIAYAASYVEWFAEEATRANGDIIPQAVRGRKMSAYREPVGIVAAITPWNFPAAMIARKIAPALAAGCTVVCKPAAETPLTALALVKLAEEAGVPAGVLNIVITASSKEVADVWLDDARVRKITFTGSTPVGKHLAHESSRTLKKLALELGGNAPFIVFDDADIDAAVEGLMVAKFRNGGQTCVCPNRVYVQSKVYGTFLEKLTARVSALVVGPASNSASQIGPMINAKAISKIEEHVNDAVARGARVLTGGQRLFTEQRAESTYYAPTVLADVDRAARCFHEETFGPVAPITSFETEAEVIEMANDSPFGLASYFYTNDMRRVHRVTDALECGIVGVNEGALAAEAAPFGGVKDSGYGREGSVHGLEEYMHIKYVCQGGLE
ncbi:Glutarate-semialdehyde dehydrogenase DavD [Pseudomonas reidholzensis]|uniref:Glutarate-semialdehyde dehydrogenase DavD n=1 Tax=Pseudomonas reidholzensis TaxID=1785162 RepID=A0A383RT81_9PSED|nr:NAD-dependent succinate-semialdehyde dehydrogenase [Pseudomonas reidholzensis]SYX90262.1 Glutarate-semialdehyde dehydrogenase DavD [Pseudomonas reidholzensis]